MREKENEFLDMSKLKAGFESLDKRIRYSHMPKEELIKEKEDLLKTAKELEIMDLRILYYVKNCSYVFRSTLLKCLNDLYDAERAYKKLLQKPNE